MSDGGRAVKSRHRRAHGRRRRIVSGGYGSKTRVSGPQPETHRNEKHGNFNA
jgi:hypothetical protein